MTDYRWYNIIGLVLDLFGAGILARGLFVSRKVAIELGVPRYAGNTVEANLKLPAVKNQLMQSHNAKMGLIFLIIGFLFQIYGSWPRQVAPNLSLQQAPAVSFSGKASSVKSRRVTRKV